jgi:murein L,D-transpeptidase YcbB/YkuD
MLSAAAVGPALAEGEAQPSPAATDNAPAASTAATTQDGAPRSASSASEPQAPQASPQKSKSTSAADPAPDVTAPDPLTPKEAEQGPVQAPGAPARDAAAATAQPADPSIAAVRARLESWGDSRSDERADLEALKAYYAEPTAARIWTTPSGITPRAEAVLAALARADEWGLDASAFVLPARPQTGAASETLAETEIGIGLAVLKYARHARGGRITDPTSLSKIIDMRPRLYEPRSVLEAIAAASAADRYLEGLNPQHAGFVALKVALAQARTEGPVHADTEKAGKGSRAPRSDTERRIIVNMERWRWLPDDLGPFYVWDNVPEQYTRVFHDGKVVLKEKIVVGKPNTPTPVFSAPMRFVIFHPSWGVPDGIKSNELAPMLRRAQENSGSWFFGDSDGPSRVLRRYELRVYRGGREVSPDQVNWSSVDVRQFSFTQGPSGRNVLGIVKFRFPNKFDVYMHDTPERNLFSRTPRTFSHGCMRVENPLKLAETILAYDKGWGRERIAQMVARGSTTDVTLDKTVPVHIVYFTATVDETGKLHSHGDVYGVDSRVASALWGRSVVLASARSESEAQPVASPRREGQARRSSQRVKSKRPSGDSDFNPFGFLSAN